VIARLDRRQRDVGAFRKDRMIFQHRPEFGQVIRIDVIDPEHRMRIAHAHDGGRMQDRIVDRPDLQFDRTGVAELFGEGNLVPGKTRRTHIDGEQPRRQRLPAIEHARIGFEGEFGLAGFIEQQRRHAAHTVAAGARVRSVIVENADARIGARDFRRIERHQLVKRRALRRRGRARFAARDRQRLVTHVNDDDLVSDTVHLDEGMIGERAHNVRALLPDLYGRRPELGQRGTRLRQKGAILRPRSIK
jgi:hypothetical protein